MCDKHATVYVHCKNKEIRKFLMFYIFVYKTQSVKKHSKLTKANL